jgi:hypothetical protein
MSEMMVSHTVLTERMLHAAGGCVCLSTKSAVLICVEGMLKVHSEIQNKLMGNA